MNRFKTNNRIGYKILSAVTAIGMSLSLAPVVHAEDAKKVDSSSTPVGMAIEESA